MVVLLSLACVAPSDPAAGTSGTDPAPPGSTVPTTTTPTTPPVPSVDCDALAVRADGRHTFYESNPTYDDPEDRLGPYPVVTPEAAGLDPSLLQQATDALDGRPFVDSLLVFRSGQLGWEVYLHGAGPQDSHNVHSSSKSVLAAAAGVAVSRGQLDLDAPVASYLPEAFGPQG